MTIAKNPVVVAADDWESIKATFMLLTNTVDSELLDEICENAIAKMNELQGDKTGEECGSQTDSSAN